MTAWSPGIRDNAIDGLGTLLRRRVWRNSPYRERISETITAALTDDNPVVRMNAAHAFSVVYVDATSIERTDMLRVLLINEANGHVAETLVGVLGNEVNDSADQVDEVLSAIAGMSAGWNESTRPSDSDSGEETGTSSALESDGTITLITFLAVRHQTPFATTTMAGWVSSPAHAPQLLSAIPFLRDYLAPQTEPELQSRAFDLIREAASNALTYWTSAHDANDRINEADLTAAEKARLENALHTIDTVADQIYFASDAFDNPTQDKSETTQGPAPTHEQLDRFSQHAIPVLLTCVRSKAGPVIHHAVETLIHLAHLDERRSLTALARSVTENANYAYDTLSAGAVVPYLTRLLAEQRDLVLYDPEGVEAFRTLLATYASAGDATALTLAFTLADVFR